MTHTHCTYIQMFAFSLNTLFSYFLSVNNIHSCYIVFYSACWTWTLMIRVLDGFESTVVWKYPFKHFATSLEFEITEKVVSYKRVG